MTCDIATVTNAGQLHAVCQSPNFDHVTIGMPTQTVGNSEINQKPTFSMSLNGF